MSKKTKEWKESCVDYIIGHSASSRNGNSRSREEEMQTYYDLYNSIYNEKDLKYVTNPFKQDDGFPATAQDYNIIKPKIDLLLGEETKRPFNFRVVRTSDIATSNLQDKAKQLLIDYVQASIMSKLGPEEQARYQEALQSGEIMTPEQIQKYLTKDYKDIAEIAAQHSLNYLKQKLNVTHEFFKGWKDALIAGEEIYYVGVINGEPYVERVNPLSFSYEQSADLEFIHEASWCCRKMNMSATEQLMVLVLTHFKMPIISMYGIVVGNRLRRLDLLLLLTLKLGQKKNLKQMKVIKLQVGKLTQNGHGLSKYGKDTELEKTCIQVYSQLSINISQLITLIRKNCLILAQYTTIPIVLQATQLV